MAEDFDYKETNNHPLEDLLNVGYAEEEPDDGDIFYTTEELDELFVNVLGVESVCHRCKSTFPFKSLMHEHLKSNCVEQDQGNSATPLPAPVVHRIIKSTASTEAVGSGYTFKGWNYATATVSLTLGEIPLHIDMTSLCYLDKGCGVILVDRTWLFEKAPTEKILKMATPLKVRDIGASRHESDEFVSMSLYFPGVNSADRPAYAHVHRELHLADGLKANLLVGNNILATERVIIDLANKSAMISSCQVTISVPARPRGRPVQRKVLVDRSLTIPPESEALVQFVCSNLPDDRDFLFKPTPHSHLTLFLHILNYSIHRVLVHNALHRPILLPRRQRLGMLTEIPYNNCFQVTLDLELAEHPPVTPNHQAGIRVPTLEPGLETRLANGIRVYREPLAVQQISDLVEEFPSIWELSGFVQISPERWMTVPLRADWQSHLHTIKPRVYPLGNEAGALVDETFDELQRQGCLVYK